MPTLLLTNVNRIHNKLDELSAIASDLKLDSIALTETWLNSDIPDSLCSLSSYSIVRKDRNDHLGRGVMLYIHNEQY